MRRKVAIKLIKAGMDSKAVLNRFEQERQALALMDHPNIAKVFDGGLTADRRPYFVMELVNGLPLNRYCDEARLSIRERLELFLPICHAVQHAHQKGIIHRDLKPSNVLVTVIDGQPVPKVIDFGVAKATSGRLIDETVSTQFGAVVGTLEYMSPEQAGYSGADIDTRSDIYSLGVILYELLTGLRPIDARRLKQAALTEMIRIIREEEPTRPSTRISTDAALPSLAAVRQTEPKRLMTLLRGELDWVVMKCLEKQRDRRYESAGALSRDIQRYLADQPVEARPPSVGYRLRKFLHRHQIQVIAAGLLLVAQLGVATTSLVSALYRRAERQRTAEVALRHEAEAQKQSADEQRALAERRGRLAEEAAQQAAASKEQVRQILYAADIQVAWSYWDANRPDKMREVLQRHIPAANDADYRGFEWRYLWRLANGSQRSLRGHSQPVHDLAFAGSSATLLSGDVEYQYRSPGTLRRWNTGSGDEPRTLFTQAVSPERAGYFPGIRSLVASLDGSRCALVDGNVVRVLDVETGAQPQSLEVSGLSCRSIALAPNGRQLAIGDRGGQITLWDLSSGEQRKVFQKHRLPILCLEFSPDGTLLAAGGGDDSAPTWSELLNGELRLWNVESGQLVGECAAVRSRLKGLSFHPRGGTVAAGTMEGTVVLWDVNRTDGGRILRGHSGSVNAVRWLPDGRFLASSGDDGIVRVWDIGREQGTRIYKGHHGAVAALAASPDGKLLASAGRDAVIQLWDPYVDPLRTMISDLPWAIGTVMFSADSRYLLTGTYSQVTVFDTQRFEKRHVLPIDHWVYASAISPDGRWVATAGNRGATGAEPGIVKVWDVATGAARLTLDPQMQSTAQVAFSPDGRLLACGGRTDSRDAGKFAVMVWDLESGRRLRRFDALSFDFSPDGKAIAVAGPGGAWLARCEEPATPATPIATRPFREIRFSPDGQGVALLDTQEQLSIWSQAESREQPLGRARHGVTFSPDRRRIAAAGKSAVQVWDVARSNLVTSIPEFAPHLQFSPDGRTIVTAGTEIRLWQAETGRELLNLGAYATAGVNSLAISPNGHCLAVGGGYRDEHEGVWVWVAPPATREQASP